MVDVLVIGGGMAGTLAALQLQRSGARVALARGGWGATSAFTGAFDCALSPALSALGAGAPHSHETAAAHVAPWGLGKHLDDIVGHEPLHPFSLMGPQAALAHMTKGFALLQQVLEGHELAASAIDSQSPCMMWPSMAACLSPAVALMQAEPGTPVSPFRAEAPAGTWGVLNLAASDVAMGPRTQAGWLHDAEQFGLPVPTLKQVVPDQAHVGLYSGPLHLARHLDDVGAAQTFAQKLVPLIRGLDGLIVPPVLGLTKHRAVLRIFKQVLGLPVVEALASGPGVPGVRLMQALEAALVRAEVRLVSPITQVVTDKEQFTCAKTVDHGDLYAGACVLATGRFWAGGLHWERGRRCVEPLFGLPVMTATGPLVERNVMEVVRRRPEEAHPLMTAGIGVDGCLRPLGVSGQPLRNVRAAGLVIGGFSPRDARCADGVALATAHRAAEDLLRDESQEVA